MLQSIIVTWIKTYFINTSYLQMSFINNSVMRLDHLSLDSECDE